MRSKFVAYIGLFVAVLVISGAFAGTAYAGKSMFACEVGIFKLASGTPRSFDFNVDPSVGDSFVVSAESNDDTGFGLSLGESAVISELVPEGWTLAGIDCSLEGGVIATWDVKSNETFVSCVTGGFVGCTYRNVPVNAIPTLSEWGMIAAAAGLAMIGAFFAVRRRRAQAA
jgi:hypothetical protein